MPEFMINGVIVNFPYEPYSVQQAYMEKVIECLKLGVNGMLESPTGTGKTLSLLCASLSWLTLKKAQFQAEAHGAYQMPDGDFVAGLQNSLRDAAGPVNSSKPGNASWGFGPPQIIYASRTHTQLTQAIQELKKASYKHIKVAVLGSRDQMCIHPDVSRVPENHVKINMCQSLTKSGSCYFLTNLDRKKGDQTLLNPGVMDIEDLVKSGHRNRVCPYFLAREMKNDADIIFMPYNYILDQKRMKAHGVKLDNNVIILDEAHNIEKICEESVSVKIRSIDVALCIQEISQVMQNLYENSESAPVSEFGDNSPPDFSPDELCILKAMFLELENAVDEIPLSKDGSTFPGSYIIELLAKAEITAEKSTFLLDLLQRVIQFLSVTGTSPFATKGAALQKIVELLMIVFRSSTDSSFSAHIDKLKRCFKVHVTEEESKGSKSTSDSWGESRSVASTKKGRVINYMCFTPGFGMKQLLANNVRCVILTSGTLSPLPPLISELSIPIPVTLENPHVIGPDQVSVSILTKGPDGHSLNSSYSTRNDPKYISSLGNTVLNISRVVPHGILVFFPSYPILYKCKEEWQQSGLWSKIFRNKPIFVESKSKDTFASTITDYYSKVQDPAYKGACFMAVTRGKVSEGLDFMDVNGRAVIITGLPYPPMLDPYVMLKKKYLQENQNRNDGTCLKPDQWYLYEASRAVNQAVGRIIRHKNDYGAILLCDSRFDGPAFKKALSLWVQPHIKKYETFGPLLRDLRNFFVNAEKTLPPPRVSGPGAEVKLPIASGASFGEVYSRPSSSKSESRRKAIKLATKTDSTSDWTPDMYLSSSSNKKTGSLSKEKKDLFGGLEAPTAVINFNDMTGASSSKSLFKWNAIEQPTKKMKLKLPPPKIPSLSQESIEANVVNPNILRPSTSKTNTVNSEPEKTKTDSDKSAKESKQEIIKYLKEVKKSLDQTSYAKFTQMTHDYDKKKDFDKLVGTLREIMLEDGRNFKHLFRGYRRFMHSKHRKEFDIYCSTILPES